MNKTLIITALAAIMLLSVASMSQAGTTTYEVTIGSNYAYGDLATAQASSDNRQYIGCYTMLTNGSTQGYCAARSASGRFKSCLSFDSNVQEVMQSVSGGSHVYFRANASGICDYVYVSNSSQFRAKGH